MTKRRKGETSTRSSTCGETIRGIEKGVEEKSSICLMTKGVGTL